MKKVKLILCCIFMFMLFAPISTLANETSVHDTIFSDYKDVFLELNNELDLIEKEANKLRSAEERKQYLVANERVGDSDSGVLTKEIEGTDGIITLGIIWNRVDVVGGTEFIRHGEAYVVSRIRDGENELGHNVKKLERVEGAVDLYDGAVLESIRGTAGQGTTYFLEINKQRSTSLGPYTRSSYSESSKFLSWPELTWGAPSTTQNMGHHVTIKYTRGSNSFSPTIYAQLSNN